VFQRYGKTSPTTATSRTAAASTWAPLLEITARLQTALYFIGSRWQDPDAAQRREDSNPDPDPSAAVRDRGQLHLRVHRLTFGRTGPVTRHPAARLRHAKQQDRSYPVIYMLHGYGQTPEDLGAAIIFIRNWMNNPATARAASPRRSSSTSTAAAAPTTARPSASAATSSPTACASWWLGGLQDEKWWLELMDDVDTNYRTMAELVSAGLYATSTNFKMSFTLGQPTPSQETMRSTNFRMQGGLQGANGSLP
jgi:hypothetical protein